MLSARAAPRPPRLATRERSLTRITSSFEGDLSPGMRAATTNLPLGEKEGFER
jgi:hypothetical protein